MSYEEIIEERDGFRVKLVQDEDCTNPREDDEYACGALTLPGSRYMDVTEPGDLANEASARLFGSEGRYYGHHAGRYSERDGVGIFERWVRVFHGGVTLYDTPNEGPGVIWYITPEMMRARGFEGDKVTDATLMAEIIKAERDTYRAWAEGDVWGYVVERDVEWLRNDPEGSRHGQTMHIWEETDDSLWGMIGREYAEAEARMALSSALGETCEVDGCKWVPTPGTTRCAKHGDGE